MEWTNELIFEFSTLYENEPALWLWNSSSPQHKNKNDVHDAWLRIKSNLADETIPITELKKKKENLMSTYRKVKAKIKESMKTGSGTDSIYKPEWPFYDLMTKFLDNVHKPRKTKTTTMVSNFYLYLIIGWMVRIGLVFNSSTFCLVAFFCMSLVVVLKKIFRRRLMSETIQPSMAFSILFFCEVLNFLCDFCQPYLQCFLNFI